MAEILSSLFLAMGRKKLKRSPFGLRLEELRGDLTLEEFAPLVDIHHAQLSEYETGKKKPGLEQLTKIARIAELKGKSTSWLLLGKAPYLADPFFSAKKEQFEVIKTPQTAEEMAVYLDNKRLQLVQEVKKLIGRAQDRLIESLLEEIKILNELLENKKADPK